MRVVARQPIFDRQGEICFYELFLQDRILGRYPAGIDPLKATSIVTDLILELGPEKVGNGKMVFINVPAIFLEALMFDLLPQKFVGIELVEHRISDSENLFESLKKLFKCGFTLCIDDFGFERIDYLPILSKAQLVKIDLKNNPYKQEELFEVVSILKELKKGVIIKNIETTEDYEYAQKLEADFFQGVFLAKPIIVKDARTMSFLRSTIIQIYEGIKSDNTKWIIQAVEKDLGATYKLLRFVNALYQDNNKTITSVEEAVSILGIENIVKFALVLAMSDFFLQEKSNALWQRSLFRASLAEKLAQIFKKELSEKAYLMGLFSLSLEVLGQRPADVARSLGLDRDIVVAFEDRLTPLGFILSMVELLEDNTDAKTIHRVAKIVDSSPELLKSALDEAKSESGILAG